MSIKYQLFCICSDVSPQLRGNRSIPPHMTSTAYTQIANKRNNINKIPIIGDLLSFSKDKKETPPTEKTPQSTPSAAPTAEVPTGDPTAETPAPAGIDPAVNGTSVNGTAGAPAKSSQCFPGSAYVENINGVNIKMDELSIGDIIKVGNDKYEKVVFFGRYNKDEITDMSTIHTYNKYTITTSHAHFIKVINNESTHTYTLKRASDIKIGDILETTNGISHVTHTHTTHNIKGLYAPITTSGNIYVNGIYVSIYAGLPNKQLDSVLPIIYKPIVNIAGIIHNIIGSKFVNMYTQNIWGTGDTIASVARTMSTLVPQLMCVGFWLVLSSTVFTVKRWTQKTHLL
eukprot:GHVR01187270.1.p1 GENE.GHVR01187270.1~~GHVR01187270.1.p1  ORF type:complete len:351 (-),score=96.05 GHVR01187270.1:193-1221(-)